MRRRPSPTPVDPKVLLSVLAQVKAGDFTARMPLEWTGVAGKVADGLNDVIIANQALEAELARVSEVVGKQGRLSQRVVLGGSAQSWSGSVESVNNLIEALVRPTSEMQRVIGAVADGDLSKKVTVDVHGEMLELKNTINAMVDQLNGFVSEVTRVAREVGTEGKLGQAAAVTIEVGGVWKDLTDNVNLMAGNLTGQVRNIAEVTTAVANGDLSKKISIDVKGEFLELKNTVNAMVDQLNAFAGEVTRVAREVGVEGKLGGQAQSKEVAGVWKDLTDNVNQLAANLTNQVRAIAEVATAVTEGDLTRQVGVEASGEVAVLKDKLNEMIRNLRETTRQNIEQDWLKTNRERFTRMLQGQDDLGDRVEHDPVRAGPAGLGPTRRLLLDDQPDRRQRAGARAPGRLRLRGAPAPVDVVPPRRRPRRASAPRRRSGSCSPRSPATTSGSTRGSARPPPLNIIVLPVLFEGIAVAPWSSWPRSRPSRSPTRRSSTRSPRASGSCSTRSRPTPSPRTCSQQSQSLAEELRSQQDELRESNEDLERQASLLAERNREASNRNQEVEQSKRLVEEKAAQLAISSKYKSEFIANMSHELRTPLNSLLILAEQLKDNPDHNMTDTQVQYASVIRASGNDLLSLLNSILDLAKVESGTMEAELADCSVAELRTRAAQRVRARRQGKGPRLLDRPGARQPRRRIVTDPQRLRQILKNLLANAFKFTEQGAVHVQVGVADDGWSRETESLADAPSVIAFAVSDTGIGIDDEQQQRIFEAFAQGDGTTARLYGGTGLGLSISRELAGLLGGRDHPHQHTRVRAAPSPSTSRSAAPPRRPLRCRPHLAPGRADRWARARSWPDRGRAADRRPSRLEAPTRLIVATSDGRDGRRPRRDEDPRRRRRLPQHLRLVGAPRARPRRGAHRRERLRGPRHARERVPTYRHRPHGHHDADHGRLRRPCGPSGRSRRFKTLPIIAVTGKVMAGERQRCIDAGANDYVPKPDRHRRAPHGRAAVAPDDRHGAARRAGAVRERPVPTGPIGAAAGRRRSRGRAAARCR